MQWTDKRSVFMLGVMFNIFYALLLPANSIGSCLSDPRVTPQTWWCDTEAEASAAVNSETCSLFPTHAWYGGCTSCSPVYWEYAGSFNMVYPRVSCWTIWTGSYEEAILGWGVYVGCVSWIPETCQCGDISMSVTPPDVRPQQTGQDDKTTASVFISLSKPAPSSGCEVRLRVEPVEGTGGHSHDGNRKAHTGSLSSSFAFFLPGEMEQQVEYTSGEVAGSEKIVAELVDANGNVRSTRHISIDVKVSDLRPLGGSEYYILTGARSAHPSNHYGQFWTNWMIDFVASDYFEETGAMLGINDMSLEWGGLFDIGPSDGTFWSTPHRSHRIGSSVDIDRTTCVPSPCASVDKKILDRIARYYGGFKVVEPTIHYEF